MPTYTNPSIANLTFLREFDKGAWKELSVTLYYPHAYQDHARYGIGTRGHWEGIIKGEMTQQEADKTVVIAFKPEAYAWWLGDRLRGFKDSHAMRNAWAMHVARGLARTG